MLFEGYNSLTILGIHMLIMGVAGIILKKLMPIGGIYYLILFTIVLIVGNVCVFLFNRYVPFLINQKRKK